MKYAVITFGCRVNQADSLGFEEELLSRGGVAVAPSDAELVVVNTCSVTATADQGARQTIRRISRDNPAARIVVTGCYATRRPDEIRLLPNVAQVVLPLVAEPLAPLLAAAADGRLPARRLRTGIDAFTGVVLASRGYPQSSSSGDVIHGIDAAEAIPGVAVYHAGTALRGADLVTAGGRVLTVVGRGADHAEAIARAYAGVLKISFDGMQFRQDIGRKALHAADRAPSVELP